MKTVRRIKKTVFLFIMLAAFAGCNSKPDKTSTSAAPTQDKTPSTPEKSDASTAATRYYSLLKAGDYSTIYKESAPNFQKFGSESAFISKMQQIQKTTGTFNNAKEVGYQTVKDNELGVTHVISSYVQYGNKQVQENLAFVRSKSGKMQLCGIAQDATPK